MQLIKKVLLLVLCFSLYNPIIVVLAENKSQSPKILTTTLLVNQYNELEKSLEEAIFNADVRRINTLLAADFEERESTQPNSPIPKEKWIKNKLNQPAKKHILIKQMAVRELTNFFIVSYLAVIPKPNEIKFIVDIWQEDGKKSNLLARYSSIV